VCESLRRPLFVAERLGGIRQEGERVGDRRDGLDHFGHVAHVEMDCVRLAPGPLAAAVTLFL
jgi:hypothetical protein